MNCPSCKCDVLPAARYCCSCGRRLVTKKDSNDNKHRVIEGAVGDVVKISPPGPFHSNERHLELLMDSIPAYVSYVDADERYRWVNKKCESWYQRSRHEIIGKTVRELQSDTHYENMRDCIRQALCGVPVRYENSLTDDGGQTRTFDTHYLPDRTDDGKVLGFFVLVFDVTHERTARESLRASEARLAESQRIAKLGSWNLDLQTNRLDWSAEIFRIFEMDPRIFGASYESFLSAIHPDDRERVNEAYTNSLVNREPYEITHRLQMPDGAIKWVTERCETIFDADRRPLQSIGTVLDVTDRKQAEAALRASEERWRTFVDHAADAFFIHDSENNGRILDVNRQACESLGYSREELIGKYPTDIDPEITPQRLAQITADLQAGKSVIFDSVHRRKDGSRFPVAIRVRPFDADERQYAMTTCRDITDRKQAEETLRENEARTRQIIDGLFGFIGLCTLEGILIDANEAPLRAAGLCREDVLGRPFWDTYCWNYDEGVQAELKSALMKAACGETVRYEPNVRVLGGALITVDVTFGPLRNSAGEITHVLGFGVDITDRKRADEARRESEQRYRMLVENSPYCIHELDQEGRFLSMNQAGLRMLGETEESCILGGHYLDCVSEIDKPHIAALLQEARTGRTSEFVFTSVTGRFLSSNFVPLATGRIMGITADITERKRSEEQLRAERNFTSAVLDSAGALVVVLDHEGRIRRFNRAASQLSGYSFAQVEGRFPWETVLPPDIAETVRKQAFESFAHNAEKTSARYSNEWLTRNGDRRLIEWSNTILRDSSGRLDFMVSIGIDVTERQQAEAALRASEERFRLVWEYAADGMRLTDLQGRIHAVNETFCQVFGKRNDEIVGQNLTALYAEADQSRIAEGYRKRFEEHEIARHLERQMTLYDGRQLWFEVSNCFIETDPTSPLLLAIFRDITERKHAEALLQAMEQKSSAILNALPDMMFRIQRDGVFVDCRATDENALQAPIEKIIGGRIADFLPPEVASLAHTHVKAALDSKKVQMFDYSLPTPSGIQYFEARIAVSGADEVVAIVRDITESKLAEAERLRAEQELRKSEERFSTLFYSSPFSVLVATYPDSIITLANDAFLRIFGFQRHEVIGKSTTEINIWVNPSDRQLLLDRLRDGQARKLEFNFRTKAGEVRTLVVSVELIELHGKMHSVAMSIDITERKRAELDLRESRDRLNEIAETISEVFWSAESGIAKTLFVSPSYERVWGRSCASLRESPRSFIEAIHPKDRERVVSNLVKHQSSGQPFEIEYRIIQPDGSERWIWDRGFPIKGPHGSISRYVGSAMDITARKAAEETLEAHSQVLWSMAEGVVFLNEQGIILFTNHALDRMFRYAPGELVGQPVTILNDATLEENERIVVEVMATMTASRVWSGEFRNRRKDGTVFWTAATISEIHIQNQRGFVSVQQDITVRKQAEEQIDMLRNQLAHAARLGTLGELASGLAHELNQPLAALHLYASTALKLEPGSNREELVDCIQQISKESLRAGEIVRRMRAFATPATSRRASVNLNQLIEEVLMIVAVNLRHSGVKLLLELDVSVPLVLADRIQIQQVVVNLIRNALDAMAATAEEMRFLTIQTVAFSDSVRVSVIDTGSGIDSSIADRLFQAFQTSKPNGLGLGLAISRTLIEAHGGWIAAEPSRGCGATFYFFLPYNRESAS